LIYRNLIGISNNIESTSHVLLGLQETAAEKLDGIFEVDETENSEPSVIKMLSKEEELRSRPYRIRTCDT